MADDTDDDVGEEEVLSKEGAAAIDKESNASDGHSNASGHDSPMADDTDDDGDFSPRPAYIEMDNVAEVAEEEAVAEALVEDAVAVAKAEDHCAEAAVKEEEEEEEEEEVDTEAVVKAEEAEISKAAEEADISKAAEEAEKAEASKAEAQKADQKAEEERAKVEAETRSAAEVASTLLSPSEPVPVPAPEAPASSSVDFAAPPPVDAPAPSNPTPPVDTSAVSTPSLPPAQTPTPLRPEVGQFFSGAAAEVLAMSTMSFLQTHEADAAAVALQCHRYSLSAFATAHAQAMLKTLDAALERFASAPDKLWEACRKRYGELVDPFQMAAISAVGGVQDALTAAQRLSRETAEWNDRASAPLTRAASLIATTPAGITPSAAVKGVPSTVKYAAPPASVDVGGGRLLALTPNSASTRPISSLEVAAEGLAALPAAEWHKLALISSPAPALAAVLASACALLGIEVSWRTALAELAANCSIFAGRAAQVTTDAWALAADLRDAGGPTPRLERAHVLLARKLLAKRPDVRAEAPLLVIKVTGAAEGDFEAPLPIIAALAEWEFALVYAVDAGQGFNQQRQYPPVKCALRE